MATSDVVVMVHVVDGDLHRGALEQRPERCEEIDVSICGQVNGVGAAGDRQRGEWDVILERRNEEGDEVKAASLVGISPYEW